MKDLRNVCYDINERTQEFIDLLEKDGAEVTVLKTGYTFTDMNIVFADGFQFNNKYRYDHHIIKPEEYYKGLFQELIKQERYMQRLFGKSY